MLIDRLKKIQTFLFRDLFIIIILLSLIFNFCEGKCADLEASAARVPEIEAEVLKLQKETDEKLKIAAESEEKLAKVCKVRRSAKNDSSSELNYPVFS